MNKDKNANKLRRKRGVFLLPNILTTANLFFGFYAMLAAAKESFAVAGVFIVMAAALDGLDGRIARMTNTMSKFGAEYDSLADLATFGIAPAILVYFWAIDIYGRWGWFVSFLFVVCGALRLARFNVQSGITESKVFNGLPIPAAASLVATSVMLYFYLGGVGKYHNILIFIAVFVLALLMVSNVKYYSFKNLNFFSRKPFMSFVLILIIIMVIVAEPEISLFILAFFYAASGPVWWLISAFRMKQEVQNEEIIKKKE